MEVKWMRLALSLALKAKGETFPNPLVGAVVVKDGKFVSSGYHQRAGGPHAEVIALDQAAAQGADLYVTLEPCNHVGRTPPCVPRILESGIQKIFIGMIDPNPKVNGKGVIALQQGGISVAIGLLEKECQRLNEPYLKFIRDRIPFVTLKTASSLDGKIATGRGDSKWITSDKSLDYAHQLRHGSDAVLVGIGTVLKDNPRLLTYRIAGKNPRRIVVDSRLRIPLTAKVLAGGEATWIFTTTKASRQKRQKLEKMGVRIFALSPHQGQVSLRELLTVLGKNEIQSLLVEGGSRINASFLRKKLVDKVVCFIAPKIIGGEGLSSFAPMGIKNIQSSVKIRDYNIDRMGDDLLLEGYPEWSPWGRD